MKLARRAIVCAVGTALFGLSLPIFALAGNLQFNAAPFANNEADQRSMYASDQVTVDGIPHDIGFHTILRSGDRIPSQPLLGSQWTGTKFGLIINELGKPIVQIDGSETISSDNDFSSLLNLGLKGLWMVSHFESRPAAMYLTKLHQYPNSGELTALQTRPIDFSKVHGGWVHCAGSVTPWSTHLGSEEYEPDARLVNPATGTKILGDGVTEDDYYHAMDVYFSAGRAEMNPYYWGYPVEVSVLDAAGDTQVVKHYAMGRLALELAYVMPDRKTAYLTDDGTDTGLFMFVADVAGDLSAGELYAAKWHQTSPDGAAGGGSADLTWVDLGHATDAQIAPLLTGAGKLTFADIFDAQVPAGDSCAGGYTLVAKGHDATLGDTYKECLKLKPGMALAASRLETRRYAALIGATTEFRKMEGATFDGDSGKLYIAMSEVSKGMENNSSSYDIPSANDIRLANNNCGAVYGLDVGTDAAIGSQYVAKTMYGEVAGINNGVSPNTCDIDGIANPDNLSFINGYNTLMIGEDTGSGHRNDVVWAYDLGSKSLTRVLSTPYGSETTSVYWYPNINGFGYLMAVAQHPYGESDSDKYEIGSLSDRAYTGYVGPFPAMGSAASTPPWWRFLHQR